MSYANETQFRAAVRAYRALHVAFYRFRKSVQDQTPLGPVDPVPSIAAGLLAGDERDHALMERELLPCLASSFAGPPVFVARLAETLGQLGQRHREAPGMPFDLHLTQQAYVDVDNILQDLLREREHYPQAFDEAFAGVEPRPEETAHRSPRREGE